MAKFMLVYLGGEHPSDPGEGEKHFEAYRNWLLSLGDAVISAVNPLKDTHVLDANCKTQLGTSTMMSGFSVLEANSIEAAVLMSESCPFLDIGGRLEVSELIDMDM